jgi:hypothetical protein
METSEIIYIWRPYGIKNLFIRRMSMKRTNRVIALGLLLMSGVVWGCVAGTANTTPPPASPIVHGDLRVTELGMVPDPVQEGYRIRFYLAIYNRSAYSGRARVMIQDRDQKVSEVDDVFLRPRATTNVQFPFTNYRFTRHDHCFTVLVDLAGTYHAVDLSKRFCAKPAGHGVWTLKDN